MPKRREAPDANPHIEDLIHQGGTKRYGHRQLHEERIDKGPSVDTPTMARMSKAEVEGYLAGCGKTELIQLCQRYKLTLGEVAEMRMTLVAHLFPTKETPDA